MVQLDTAFDEESISKIYFFTTFTDTDPGNAGLLQTSAALPGGKCRSCLLGIGPAHSFREGMQHAPDMLCAAAGTYTLQFPCQFDFNSVAIFNPVGEQHSTTALCGVVNCATWRDICCDVMSSAAAMCSAHD